jgi:sugar phosphate isomerase/epimerase
MVAEAMAQIIPDAVAHGVQLGIEPLHPIYAADRSVITTLAEALDLVERLASPQVGVVIDAYHVWWDPYLYPQVQRAGGHIVGFHISDWLVPTPHMLLGRGMPGDGVIELRRIRCAVDAAWYSGPIEVEIFNQTIWDTPGDEVLARVCERYLAHV